MAPGDLEHILDDLGNVGDGRVLAGIGHGEDAAVLTVPQGLHMVQTLDFFTPIVNDPYRFGRIAAANSISDIYAMGGVPYSALNIVCFPVRSMDVGILKEILRGGLDIIRDAGAVLVGGHSVDDQEMKYGLSITGFVEPGRFATNAGLCVGDQLVLTKPLGTGILATAVKAHWEDAGLLEDILYQVAGRLNRVGGELIRDFGLRAATDVTGFGLGGHLLEMARASRVRLEVFCSRVPVIPQAAELAGLGLVPEGSHANRRYCACSVVIKNEVDPVLLDLVFDAQTSGGLILAVPEDKLESVCSRLLESGDLAAVIGRVVKEGEPGAPRLMLHA